jgi:hypothetical protein
MRRNTHERTVVAATDTVAARISTGVRGDG